MICFRDRMFCSEISCCNDECDRRMTEGIVSASIKCGLPISQADLKDSELCPGYQKCQSQDSASNS